MQVHLEFMLMLSQKNQDFYDFFRSLEAYRKSFKGKDDILVLDPNSDFFKFLKSPDSK